MRTTAPPTALALQRPWLFADVMAVSTALAAAAGMLLGVLAAADLLPSERWSGAVQAHRDIQLIGWAAVYVSALAFEFVVRLNQSKALPEGPRLLALALLGAGAIAQAGGQLFAAEAGWLWLPGSLASLAGAGVAAVLIAGVKPGFAPDSRSHSLWLRLAMAWLVVVTAAGVAVAVRGTHGVAPLADSRALAEIFLRGFLLSAIVGISLRAFAGHLGLGSVSQRDQVIVMVAINLSTAFWVGGSGAFELPEFAGLQRASDLLLAAALLFLTRSLGVFRAFRFEWSVPRYHLVLPWAWAGLVVYGVVLGVVALLPGWGDRTLYEAGAVRHIFLLGFMAPLMVAMAHIVLARFGTGELLSPRPLLAAFLLLQAAWPLRVVPPLASDPPSDVAKALMALAGVLTAVALALLALSAATTARALRRRNRWVKLPSLLSQP